MPPLLLRAYQAQDLDALQALDAVCFSPIFRFSRSAMRRFAEAGNAVVRVAYEQSNADAEACLAGFCIVHMERARAQTAGYVVTLDVDPRYRGQGLARRLMGALEDLARERGAVAMTLHVAVANEPAIRLYEGFGYLRASVERHFYAEGGDAFFYRKPL